MLVLDERGKPEYPEKNLSEQSREPTNSAHIWRRLRESNPGHIGGRRALYHCANPAPKARARIHAFGASRLSILILKINFTCRTHIHWLGDGHITSNNETILAKSPLASNFAKANVELQLLTPIAREESVTEGGMMLSDDWRRVKKWKTLNIYSNFNVSLNVFSVNTEILGNKTVFLETLIY